jgi:hypothetical protein
MRERIMTREERRAEQRRDYGNLLLGFALGIVVTGIGFTTYPGEPRTCEQINDEFTAYRHCMQQGGQCRMTAADFIRYYEVKAEWEQCNGTPISTE